MNTSQSLKKPNGVKKMLAPLWNLISFFFSIIHLTKAPFLLSSCCAEYLPSVLISHQLPSPTGNFLTVSVYCQLFMTFPLPRPMTPTPCHTAVMKQSVEVVTGKFLLQQGFKAKHVQAVKEKKADSVIHFSEKLQG